MCVPMLVTIHVETVVLLKRKNVQKSLNLRTLWSFSVSKTQAQNPVMLLVYISAILTTGLWIISLFGFKDTSSGYTLAIAIILWFTCIFANFAEAIAEGRGKAQADSLRASKKDVEAHKIPSPDRKEQITNVSSATLKKGDIVIVKAGEQIPGDGEVIEGAR